MCINKMRSFVMTEGRETMLTVRPQLCRAENSQEKYNEPKNTVDWESTTALRILQVCAIVLTGDKDVHANGGA
uniref:Uncharacterized protein n=1 Tax=Knipowitschia caucasica TaxID=637954 RepID=A0AAV2LHW6_KNICA